jgi:hypothetical protein
MAIDPDTIARKAKQMCKNEPDFLDCTVEVGGPPHAAATLLQSTYS